MASTTDPKACKKDIFIAVMGPTGTGKSTFVNLVTKSDKMGVGHGMRSHTAYVQSSDPIQLFGHRVTLLDTPGFNDTKVAEIDVLKQIALFLQTTHDQGFPLSGVIYMHSITTNRMSGSSLKNLAMFRELCGTEALKNVAVVTNRWEDVHPATAKSRERELLDGEDFFRPLVDKQARVLRHNNSYNSAINIVRHLVDNDPLPLRIQRELAKQGARIVDTSAAKCLQRILKEEAHRQYTQQMAQARQSIGTLLDIGHNERKSLVEKLRKEYEAKVIAVEEDQRRLARQYAEEKAVADAKVTKAKEALEKLQAEEVKRTQEIERLTEQLKKDSRLDTREKRRIQDRIAKLKEETSSRGTVLMVTFGVLAVVLDVVLLTTTGVPLPIFSTLNRLLSPLSPDQ